MSVIRQEPLTGPAVWKGSDFTHDHRWLHVLSPDAVAELESALAGLRSRGLGFPSFGKEDFPLPTLGPELARQADALENGRGFSVLRGLPVEGRSEAEVQALCFGIGLHLGTPVPQNLKGELLGAVMNVGDLNNRHTRVYETNRYLPYHSDPSDVVGLLCVRKAVQGGLSSLVSVAAIYNEIFHRYRAWLGLYHRPMYFEHLCEPRPSLSPIFSFHAGKLSCRYLRQYLELGHEVMGQPLSRVEIEALDIFDAVMLDPGFRLDMMLEPGDLQLANNYAVLHSRTEFQDHEDVAQRRKMWRLWVKMPQARALAPDFPGRNGFPPVGTGAVAATA